MKQRLIIEQPDDETGIAAARYAAQETLKKTSQFILITWPEEASQVGSVAYLSGLSRSEVAYAIDTAKENLLDIGKGG